jgi:hypothetical protein
MRSGIAATLRPDKTQDKCQSLQDRGALGEAETIAIAVRRQLNCFFATDDKDTALLATNNNVQVATTWQLLKVACKKTWLDADTLWGYVQTLRVHERGGRPECGRAAIPSTSGFPANTAEPSRRDHRQQRQVRTQAATS